MQIISCLDKDYGKKKSFFNIKKKENEWLIEFENEFLKEREDFWILDPLNLKDLVEKKEIDIDKLYQIKQYPVLVLNFLSPKIKEKFKLAEEVERLDWQPEEICENFNYLSLKLFYSTLPDLINRNQEIDLLTLQEKSDKCQGKCIYYQILLQRLHEIYCNSNYNPNLKQVLYRIIKNVIACVTFWVKTEIEKEKRAEDKFLFLEENFLTVAEENVQLHIVELKEILNTFYQEFKSFTEKCFRGHSNYTKFYFLLTIDLLFRNNKDLRALYDFYKHKDLENLNFEKFLEDTIDYIQFEYKKLNEIGEKSVYDAVETGALRQATYRFKSKICSKCFKNFEALLKFFYNLFGVNIRDSHINMLIKKFCSRKR